MVKNLHSKSVDRLLPKQSIFDRLNCSNTDTQRQVSNSIPYRYKRIQKKLSNAGWTKHMLKQYNCIANQDMLDINHVQRYGIPKRFTYVVETYDLIKSFINKYPNTKEAKSAQKIMQQVNRTTNRYISKAERYGLHIKPQEYSHVANDKVNRTTEPVKKYNGERIHIKLEEVL